MSVIAGNRRRTLVRKKSFEHAQKFSLRPSSVLQRLILNTEERLRTFVERFTIVSLSLLKRYLVVTNRLLCCEGLTGDLSTTAERSPSARSV
jgi:hypothetical protein